MPSTSAAPTAAPPTADVEIPSKRTPMPRRPKPLSSPVKCRYAATADEPPAKEVSPPKRTSVPARGRVNVFFQTTAGDIGLTLDRALAPCTVESMINLIQQGFYDGSECHRLGVEGLQMLQCGDPTGTGSGGPGYTVPDEHFQQLRYGRGMVAMANTGQPDSGGSQFFLVFGTADLPPSYTVFGSIDDEGLKTLDEVARGGVDASTGPGDGTGKPNVGVRFTRVEVIGP